MSGTLTISHEPVNNSLHPAWRNATVHLITKQSWPKSFNDSQIRNIVNDVTYRKANALRQLDPNSATYINEVSEFFWHITSATVDLGKTDFSMLVLYRQTPSNLDGSGRSTDPTMLASAKSRTVTTLKASSGAPYALVVRIGFSKGMGRFVGRFLRGRDSRRCIWSMGRSASYTLKV